MMTATPAPSLSAGICGLLYALARGAHPDGVLVLDRHAGAAALGARCSAIRVADLDRAWIPAPLLPLLESDASSWTIGLAVRSPGGQLVSLSALAVDFALPRVFVNPDQPDSEFGRQWVYDRAGQQAALARADAVLPTTITVDAGESLTCVWAFNDPIPVATADQQAEACGLLRRLAGRVGATPLPTEAQLIDVTIAIPGFVVRNADATQRVVTCLSLALEHVYDLAAVTAALEAK